MKRFFLMLLLITGCVTFISAQDLDGRFELAPFLIKLSDGRLIHPDKPYAYQYSGIVGIHFFQGSFARIFTVDSQYDAFYLITPADSDNYLVEFRLKNRAVFSLQLVREGEDVYRYYYELEDPPFEAPVLPGEEDTAAGPEADPGSPGTTMPVSGDGAASEKAAPVSGGATATGGSPPVNGGATATADPVTGEPAAEEPGVYTGVMKRIEEN